MLEPETEADPVAILAQLLVAFGTSVGRDAYLEIEATRHHPHEFLLLAGESSRARKGTSWDHARRLICEADPTIAERILPVSVLARVWSGRFATPPARTLVSAIAGCSRSSRNSRPSSRTPAVRSPRCRPHSDQPGTDGHCSCSRAPLRRAPQPRRSRRSVTSPRQSCVTTSRRSSSPTVSRTGWWSSPAAARGCSPKAARAIRLPAPGSCACSPPRSRTPAPPAAFASHPAARELWHHAYTTQLAATPSGIAGALCARAEAHVIRLALIYTLADGERHIGTEHLTAALALWDYAARSATWALQGATGDPLAEQIHAALQQHPGGLTRSQISDILQHNRPAAQIQQALDALSLAGRATRSEVPTTGRPAELWTATPATPGVCISSRGVHAVREGEQGSRGAGAAARDRAGDPVRPR